MSEVSISNGTVTSFKDAVHEWMNIHDYISEASADIRNKRKRLQQLDYFITTYLKDNDKEYCNIGNKEALCIKNKKMTSALKKEHVLSFLNQILKDEEKATEYTKRLYNMREIKEKQIIKRVNI